MRESRKPPAGDRRRLLRKHGYACAYCKLPFGCVVRYAGKDRLTALHWDHVVPFCFSEDNSAANYVPACSICNLVKSGHVVTGVTMARRMLCKNIARYEVVWYPPVSSEENGDLWADAYSAYLFSANAVIPAVA
jgi:HNH endonuclease